MRHALAILGDQEVRRWVRLIATVGAGQDKSSDLVLCALVRARFGELLAPSTRHGESDLFLLGLLSMLDAMLETPMAEISGENTVRFGNQSGFRGEPSLLRPIYQLMLAHESGEWDASACICDGLHMDPDYGGNWYWQAQQWARKSPAARRTA